MKNIMMGLSFASIIALSLTSQAASADVTNKPVAQWSCSDFIALDDSFKPTAVILADNVNRNGKPEDAVVDVEGVTNVTPALVQACQKDVSAGFVEKVATLWADHK